MTERTSDRDDEGERSDGRPLLLPDLFARTAERHGERVAIDVPPALGRPRRTTWTYDRLAGAAQAVAHGLAAHVSGECVVAIHLPRESPHLYAAQLGILVAGAAWTCVDPAFPDTHARFILDDSAPVVLLTDPAGRARFGDTLPSGAPVLDVAALLDGGGAPARPPPRPAWLTARTLAYVIYTSGTTGRPKGVLLEHGGIANLIDSDSERFGLGPDDRVGQASSPAYDSSIEETWLALAVGAAVVPLDEATVRLGPDLVPWLRAERLTVFCPPPTLLRAMACGDPQAALPDLRLLYVGGEALPQDVADAWAPGRRLENGYGPTECSVTVLRTQVRAGIPVTIGRPVRGHRAWVLDASLDEVATGEPGELCVGGVGLARGYLGRPELTVDRFVRHATLGRIYRTGDLVRRDADGDHHYLGRIDEQVKVRGYRIELGAIDAALSAQPGVREAACRVQGEEARALIAAFVVPEDPCAPPAPAELAEALARSLPAYMVPALFASLERLPTTTGGTLDRRALPEVPAVARSPDGSSVGPRTPTEARVAAAVCDVLGLAAGISIRDDFFLDLGGTSLTAALLISTLRAEATTAGLTVRDVYAARTVEAIAQRARAGPQDGPPITARRRERSGRPVAVTAVQGGFLLAELVLASALLYVGWFWILPWLLRGLGLVPLILLMPVVGLVLMLLYVPLGIGAAVCAKRLLIGRYHPLREPVWSGFHVRNWIVQQFAAAVPWGLLQDTVFLNGVLRALGARVGRGVHIHRGVGLQEGGWDLLEIGDDVTVRQDASLRLVDLVDGEVVVGPVRLKDRCTIDVRAGVSAHAVVEADGELTALSWLPAGGRVPPGERYEGVPAEAVGRAAPPPSLPPNARTFAPLAHGVLTLLVRFLGASVRYYASFALLTLPVILAFDVDASRLLAWFFEPPWAPLAALCLVALIVLSVPLALLASAIEARCLGRVKDGVLSRWGWGILRVLAKTDAVRAAGNRLSGTLFWPPWLRLAGMRIGKRCEISTIIDVVPELVTIGGETFFADGVYLGSPLVKQGTVTLAGTTLGRNTFIGNHAVIPAGTRLPDDVLLGVCTVADDRTVKPGTSWFGLPAFELPRREVVEADRSVTHEPGPLRYGTRLAWELARFLLPVLPVLVLLAWLQVVAARRPALGALELMVGVALPATVAVILFFVFGVIALKWVLLGRVRPGQHPLWSCWCSRWDFLYVTWGAYLRPALARLEGTLFLGWVLRALGVRIGKRVVLGRGFAQVVDPDMLTFEDDATVGTMFQAHSFEDRVLKIDRVRLECGAYVGSAAVLFYGAQVGARTQVAPHSVVMKHERLTPGVTYAGCPTEPQEAPLPHTECGESLRDS